jgi:hypothetical protein
MVPGALAGLAGSLGWLGPLGSFGLLAAAISVTRFGAFDVAVTTGAVALEVGRAVDLAGAGPDPVGVVVLVAGLVAAGLDGVAATVGAAWPVG